MTHVWLHHLEEATESYAGKIAAELRTTVGNSFTIQSVDPALSRNTLEDFRQGGVFVVIVDHDWLTVARQTDHPQVQLLHQAIHESPLRLMVVLVNDAHFPTAEQLPPRLLPLQDEPRFVVGDYTLRHDVQALVKAEFAVSKPILLIPASSADIAYTGRIADALKPLYGGEHMMTLGANSQQLPLSAWKAKLLLVVIGGAQGESSLFDVGYETLARTLRQANLPFIPLLVNNLTSLDSANLPEELRVLTSLNPATIGDVSFEYDLKQLVSRLDQLPDIREVAVSYLGRRFGFEPDEAALNRRGEVSRRQKRFLRKTSRNASYCLMLPFSLMIFSLVGIAIASQTSFIIKLMAFVVLLFWFVALEFLGFTSFSGRRSKSFEGWITDFNQSPSILTLENSQGQRRFAFQGTIQLGREERQALAKRAYNVNWRRRGGTLILSIEPALTSTAQQERAMDISPYVEASRFGSGVVIYAEEAALDVARDIHNAIAEKYGRHLVRLIDPTIESSDLNTLIEAASALVLLIDPTWSDKSESDDMQRARATIALALTQEVRLIPILVNDAELPRGEDFPEWVALGRHNALIFSDYHRAYAIQQLVKTIGQMAALQSQLNEYLGEVFRFTPEQLADNRAGKVSPSQLGKARVHRLTLVWATQGCGVLLALVAGLPLIYFIHQPIVRIPLVGLFLYIVGNFVVRAIEIFAGHQKVKQLDGELKFKIKFLDNTYFPLAIIVGGKWLFISDFVEDFDKRPDLTEFPNILVRAYFVGRTIPFFLSMEVYSDDLAQ